MMNPGVIFYTFIEWRKALFMISGGIKDGKIFHCVTFKPRSDTSFTTSLELSVNWNIQGLEAIWTVKRKWHKSYSIFLVYV